jgi:hypothetical protein
MTVFQVIQLVLACLGGLLAVTSVVANLLPVSVGKLKTIMLAISIDGSALVQALQGASGGVAATLPKV